MKIIKWEDDGGGQMVRVSPSEAILIIGSLCSQMRTGRPPDGSSREEFRTTDGEYFSLSVHGTLKP